MERSFLPEGTSLVITEASILRRFAKNIEHAALNCGSAGGYARQAYFDALRRADAWDDYRAANPRRA